MNKKRACPLAGQVPALYTLHIVAASGMLDILEVSHTANVALKVTKVTTTYVL